MQTDQILILCILTCTVALFLWGRWRHDMVAGASLLACVSIGLVEPEQAFSGFAHPAVITVACVLVLSRGLQLSGAVDALMRVALPRSAGPTLSIAALTMLAALLSAFMNNVGALALLMPIAVQVARKQGLAAGQILMPLAFGSILGGMTTLIGTPPNLIVSGFRAEAGDGGFTMFDFSPVGVSVAAAGVLLIAVGGWRLVPARRNAGAESFDTGAYLTEAKVPEGAKAVGRSVREIETMLDEHEAQVVGIVQNAFRVHAPSPDRIVRAGDILVLEADVGALPGALAHLGLMLEEDVRDDDADHAHPKEEETDIARDNADEDDDDAEERRTPHSDIVLQEITVLPGSALVGRSATDLSLRTQYSINLLALAREGKRSMKRLRSRVFRAGDLLLLQGTTASISAFASQFGGVPLAARELRMPDRRKAITATAILAGAIAIAAFGLAPAPVAFALGVLASMALGTVPPREVYTAIDWPVIVLLAALIPVAGAMESTGTAERIARVMFETVAQGNPVIGLALVLVVTMTLSDLMNNAATAAVMCPIAIGAAATLGVSADPYLMAVAIGASCAFLTPIGHQNNTLILGPGGFRFGDYWRLGLPVQLVVFAVSMPMLLSVWPL
ncbi:SLC13 family permease [Luteimonas sp. TWI662]|uniref:SLC13 family permease n=1 Tax=Luteimonas sp. TWI662 TaxID=3136789 RepID=UPI00320A44D5